ncbi:MAG TPA: glycoside hydrolase family 127 protein [Candidatus Hydrogenedens sp.]|nr:glycoside hydrolase family 127 protein [Candidatus Hydrogenedens sp.]
MITSILFLTSLMGLSGVIDPIPLDFVKVSGEMGRRIDITIYNNTMVMDIDGEFLKPFIEKKDSGGYVGLGKTIDALAHFAKYTNDIKVIERKEYVVNTLLKSQEEDGYIGFFKQDSRVWDLWDAHEISYIIYGLITDYRLFKNNKALEGAIKAGDYLIKHLSSDPSRLIGGGTLCEEMGTTGMGSAMLNLYEETKDKKYIDFVKSYMKLDTWDKPIITGRWGNIQGHAYAYISRCSAQMQLNQIETNENLLIPSQKVLDFLLNKNGLVITGTCGQHECWHDTQEGAANLGETCATAYLIRWWNDWLKMTNNSKFGDLMERAIYNSLFGAQSIDGRKIRYYTPFEGKRIYFDKDSYCCPCNYRRIIAELPQMIYYTDKDNGIFVNLYTPSKVEVNLAGAKVMLEQITDYPSNGKVVIRVMTNEPKEYAINFRIPFWCKKMDVRVNGESWDKSEAVSGSWLEIERNWSGEETIELEMEMKLRIIRGVQTQAGRVAIMYGPQVFCVDKKLNPTLTDKDLRLITIDPKTIEGPFPDDTVRQGGLRCTVKGWNTLSWYPLVEYDYENIILTEFPDPDGEMTYFHLPNPNDPLIENDELMNMKL